MKQLFPTLYRNTALVSQLGRRIQQNTLAHAYVIAGPRGTGKRHFARLLAAAISCERGEDSTSPLPCGECALCGKILRTGTPDLKILSRGDAATIGIDAVRRLREDIYLSPVECRKKVYIIEDADNMTAAAQNALLIVLEEPPADVLILLLCRDASLLLPTVRSRVQTLRMESFPREELDAFLSREAAAKRLKETEPDAYDAILTAANGAPGEALRLLQKAEQMAMSESRRAVMDMLSVLGARVCYSDLLSAVGKLPTKRSECIEELTLLATAVRDMILYKRAQGSELCFFSTQSEVAQAADGFSLRRLFAIWDIVMQTLTSLSENANLHVTLSAMSDALLTHRT